MMNPAGFVMSSVKDLLNRSSEEELWTKFQEEYKDEIDRLFYDYLGKVALKEAVEKYPVLKKDIADTDLPERAKNALAKDPACITTVKELVQYTPEQLAMIPSLGEDGVKAIEDFFTANGISIR